MATLCIQYVMHHTHFSKESIDISGFMKRPEVGQPGLLHFSWQFLYTGRLTQQFKPRKATNGLRVRITEKASLFHSVDHC